ncbi:MAG: hypothetical protein C0404_04505 [Verrucomicrobia bacterium]|nr:hypothetical protein [Verrucomicrobiota bacterium]
MWHSLKVAGGAAVLALLIAPPAPAIDNSDCFTCHEDKKLTGKDAAGKIVPLYVDQAKFAASVHGTNACTSCHADITEAPHPDKFVAKPVSCKACHERSNASYSNSVHGISRKASDKHAAGCTDCHGSHDIAHSRTPSSPLYHANVASTCGKCHAAIVKDVKESIHGQAMAKGFNEAPTCTDCHQEHAIEQLRSATPLKIAEQVCSRCHASERMNTKFNLPQDHVKTFFESYHGLAARLGSTRAANCASCHGFHSILPSTNPRSTVHKDNIVRTCQKCHPGATERFSTGKIHLDPANAQDIGNVVNRWVRWLYLAMIVGTIGMLSAHNLLLLRKKLLVSYRDAGRWFVRMRLIERIQHIALAVSFIYLCISGFALKFPYSWLVFLSGATEDMRRTGHRAAAVVMLALAVFHVFYLLFAREGRKLLKDIAPGRKDFLDTFDAVKYLLLPNAPKPKFGRFGYPEKAEYWAVVWGTAVMGGTGLAIWFKMSVTQWVPRWTIDVAITIHYYEAILAALAIIVWHFYHVIFDPDVYPLNWAAFDGKVPAHWYTEEHPLDENGPKKTGAGGHQEHSPEDHRTGKSRDPS